MSDQRLRELERAAADDPEARQAYDLERARQDGFHPPAVIHEFPVTDVAIKAICGNEFAAFALGAVSMMQDHLDRQANEAMIVTAVEKASVRRLARLVGHE